MNTWKQNWFESQQHYIDWWRGKGLVISMWEYLEKEGAPHHPVDAPPPTEDWNQYWLEPERRAQQIHLELSRSSLKADIPPVGNTQLGPGSLAACLGAGMMASEDTIWMEHVPDFGDDIVLHEDNPWLKVHLDLMRRCKELAQGQYYVGCPDLMEGLDTLTALKGTEDVLVDMIQRPEVLEEQLQKVNDIYFDVFNRIYDIIEEDGESTFCYFSLWAPGKVSKIQSDVSLMISEPDFRRFALPYLREQAQKIEYTLYHLDGVDAMRHLDAVLEIEELNCVQWTPGIGQPQGGDPRWYDMYRKILKAGKGIMPCWVEVNELKPLLDDVGAEGLNILMHFRSERDIDAALEIADSYR